MTRLLTRLLNRRLLVVIVAALVALGGLAWTRDEGSTTVRAYFTSTEGLHVGDEVKVLGVRVGQITDISNEPGGVLVSMRVDAARPVPADARAAIVSPSLVSGRFVQLEPVYRAGPRLEDGSTIPLSRTAVPVTFDDVKQQLTDLATALGPAPGRREGPLASAVEAVDRGLREGDSTRLRAAITGLRAAADTLSDGRSDLFTTISNLNTFTRNLALNDGALRGFTSELASVSGALADDRSDLTGAVRELAALLPVVERYFREHGTRLTTSVSGLDRLAAALADRSNELAGVLHVAPHAVADLNNTIEDQAITGRATLSGLDSVSQLLCGSVLGAGGTAEQCTRALQPLLGLVDDAGTAR